MNTLRIHGPVYALLLVVTAAAFGRLLTTPLWIPNDIQVLCEAHALNADPAAMFRHVGFYFSQPVLQLTFLTEYRLFGIEPAGYIAVNLLIHSVNAFLVYMLVNMLFPDKRLAVTAALLFALGVGSYGKVFLSIHRLEPLLLSLFHMLVLYFFIRNDFRHGGRILSPLFLAGLALYMMTGLTKSASFSLIGCLAAYKLFFYGVRRRRIVTLDILVFLAAGILFYAAQSRWGHSQPLLWTTQSDQFSFESIRSFFRYCILMVFPVQNSGILQQMPAFVRWVFDIRFFVNSMIALAIVSFSFFGFVFGNRAIRFFIAWTFITLLPFTGHTPSGGWLNLTHLYLTSIGFCVILAAGAYGCSNLLATHRWRRHLPHLIPLTFVLMSLTLTYELDARSRRLARSPQAREALLYLHEVCLGEEPPQPH